MFRTGFSELRRQTQDLLRASTLPSAKQPRTILHACPSDLQTLLLVKQRTTPAPKWTTRSDSGLYTYEGAVLGGRQVLLRLAAHKAEPLPPGFSDAPSTLLAMLCRRLGAMEAQLPEVALPVLTKDARVLIDNWEDSGLGMWATEAFRLSHLYHRPTRTWYPLTPRMETLAVE